MAHVVHFKMQDVKRLCNEYEREKEFLRTDAAKERIDFSRIHLDYTVPSLRRIHYQLAFELPRRVAAVPHTKRKDLNVMSTWVITCPKELEGDEGKRKKFFDVAYRFTQERYGADNVMLGYVHMDETSPHIHIPLVPVKDGRISAKNLFSRKELSDYHKELDAVMEREFGMKGLVHNGKTKGKYTVEELKERTRREKELSDRESALEERDISLRRREKDIKTRETRLYAQEGAFWRETGNITSEAQKRLNEASDVLRGVTALYDALSEDEKRRFLQSRTDVKPKETLKTELAAVAQSVSSLEEERRRRMLSREVADLEETRDDNTFIF